MNYLLAQGGKQKDGDYSLEDLERMAQDGSASGADLVWKEGMADWAALSTVVTIPESTEPVPPAAAAVDELSSFQ